LLTINRGFDMRSIMLLYKSVWNSSMHLPLFQTVRDNVEDLYNLTHNLILPQSPPIFTKREPKPPPLLDTVIINELDGAIKSESAFKFTVNAIMGLLSNCQHREFQRRIIIGSTLLDLQKHHMDLIIHSLVNKLAPQRNKFHDLLYTLCFDLKYPIICVYAAPPTAHLKTLEHEVFLSDAELEQAAINIHTALPQKSALGILKGIRDETGRPRYVQKIILKLNALPQHLMAYHLSQQLLGALTPQDLLPHAHLLGRTWTPVEAQLLRNGAVGGGPEVYAQIAHILHLPPASKNTLFQHVPHFVCPEFALLGSSPSPEQLEEYWKAINAMRGKYE
jgi:hypothetical protein